MTWVSATTWAETARLGLAFALSAIIGLERHRRFKSAGLRTHTLVGVGSAVFTLVSAYGFADVAGRSAAVDPSRIAAQIVSGIGFIGAGLIFIRRDAVRGLTTAAVIWLTAAVGMAAGAGLWLLALIATAGHFLVLFGLTGIASRLPRSKFALSRLRLTYVDGQGVLRAALAEVTRRDFAVAELTIDQRDGLEPGPDDERARTVGLWLSVQGRGRIDHLTASLADVPGVLTVSAGDGNAPAA